MLPLGSKRIVELESPCVQDSLGPYRPKSLTKSAIVPSAQKLLPTGIFILGNYLEIGNALPYRKNCFQELFGPVIVIKSVMENLAGKVLFFVCARDKFIGNHSGKNSEFGIKSVKKNYRYRQNCCRELFGHQKRKTVPD